MYMSPDIRERVAVVIPVHFPAEADIDQIKSILENTFLNQADLCPQENILAVVEENSAAEGIFKSAPPNSPLSGVRIYSLTKNRCKAGAIQAGLEFMLRETACDFFVTRDCDGDHFLEDIPRMVHLLIDIFAKTANPLICVMGSRSSLAKSMGWIRQEWEYLTNDFLTALLDIKLGSQGRVVDQRFWNGVAPDIQSGYRVYSRSAAEATVSCLEKLPDDRNILKFSCEFEPFVEISLLDGIFAQVNRLALVEQPISSYRNSDFALEYGSYLHYRADKSGISPETALRIFDNVLSRRELFFTDHRADLLRCRELLGNGDQSIFLQSPFV